MDDIMYLSGSRWFQVAQEKQYEGIGKRRPKVDKNG